MIYFSFVGNHDDPLKNPEGAGALINIFRKYQAEIDQVFIFTTPSKEKADYRKIANENIAIIKTLNPRVRCDAVPLDLINPVDFDIVYPQLLDAVSEIIERQALEKEEKIINITSGSPTMTSCWVLLQKSGLIPNATLVQSFEKQFARPNGETTQEVNLEIDDFPQIVAPTSLKRKLTIVQRRASELEQELQGTKLDALVPDLIGTSKAIRSVKEVITRDVDEATHVLILGDRGTGKQLVAEAIWKLYHRRKDERLSTVDCGTLPGELVISELFGYKKGAFTGAVSDSEGILRSCKGKMIFLDEIGNLPIPGQQSLLRVISHGEIRKVGSNEFEKIDLQVLAATNKNVEDPDLFAQDLKDRFDEVIELPLLKERKEDIPILANHFLTAYSRPAGLTSPLVLDDKVMTKLLDYDWPGNVRELEKWTQKMVRRFSKGGEVTLKDLPKKVVAGVMSAEEEVTLPTLPLPVSLDEYVERMRAKARKEAQGVMSEVDRLLNQSVGTEKQRKYRMKLNKNLRKH